MAGIGFELRRLLQKKSLSGKAHAYIYAALIGSGPWVISVIAILAIGMIAASNRQASLFVTQFQVSVSYLMAGSLILTSPLQLMFTRYVADRLFEKRAYLILPNLFGALTLTLFMSATIAGLLVSFWLEGSLIYRLTMFVSFILLCSIWMVQIFASAIKAHQAILGVFVMGYTFTIVFSIGLYPYGLEGLMIGFALSQGILFFTLLSLVIREHPGKELVLFSFLQRHQIFPILAFTGFFYNLGVWIDKFIFWSDDITGLAIIGPLRASPIYDFPIFLAYISTIPGMAVFLVKMEVDVAERCAHFFESVVKGETLASIMLAKEALSDSVKTGLIDLFKIQFVTTFILWLLGDNLLVLFGISPFYNTLFSIDLIAVAMQLGVLAILNILFYLDQRKLVLGLCALFCISNMLLSFLSMLAGPIFYGYGFALAVMLTLVMGLFYLFRKLDSLEYETFMLQPITRRVH